MGSSSGRSSDFKLTEKSKEMKKNPIFTVSLFVVLLLFVFCSGFLFSCRSESKSSVQFRAMNTYMSVTSYGKKASEANRKVRERIESLEKYFSVTIPESEVYRINESSENQIEIIHDETKNLLEFSLGIAEKTDGALNPCLYPVIKLWGFTQGEYRVPSESEIKDALKKTDFRVLKILESGTEIQKNAENFFSEDAFAFHSVPAGKRYFLRKNPGMMVDFGAVAKGFSGDEALKILEENGIKSALLDLGGNIQVLGAKPDGSEWNIGIKNPWEAGNPVCGIKLKDKSVVTSGGYERFFFDENGKKYIHIFDSSTGFPVENELESVTVIADSGLYADSLSTSLFVMGTEKASGFWKKSRDFEMVLITKDARLFYTSGIKDKISAFYDFSEISVIE